ncbi:3-hydroxyacyl-CoA dehydrogenase [Sphingobium sp. SCG-1]|uniref:SDR family NAD(P)-dependent oxidoreductase n=1 Tax=Sphingobium sp. SCG-1 TaxID=2072936 RepID=UPI000CD6AF93|nr:SDR family NAD(P)-dependent oxidoreductase [Sphingobium sp. SCG-1]AUW57824.1 3-hydroxyacyl-CoA dehydrogenase [Sphingobium sp. SCG-1]
MELSQVAAIVTGGASGLGAATADRLAHGGANVTIFDMNADLGDAKAKEIGARFALVDVADEAAVKTAVAQAEAAHGVARVLVNCAGVATPGKVIGRDGKASALADFSRIVTINLVGTLNVLAAFAERLHDAETLGEERGVIVNTASVAAYDGQIGQAGYAASKGGIVAITLPVAREFARYGIRVMAIAPGIFWTPLLAGLPQDAQDSLGKQVPFPSRLGKPEEYAQLVESIVANPMLNGEVIRLDGAIRMAPR